jgi:TPR repeat protein
MNDRPPRQGASTQSAAKRWTPAQIKDLPIVFLSYDEPWADEAWRDLQSKATNPVRVHGVAGLDACHKAAAEAAASRWFVTVDADTIVHREFFDIEIDPALLCDHFRLDWFSRNVVNGLVSGNGCLKVWPSALALAMRTHEAAPGDRVSLDHDVAHIDPPRSMAVQMTGCFSETNPARTAAHAFRAGFREGTFLASLAADAGGNDWSPVIPPEVAWRLLIWGSVGRHVENGIWVIYGARLVLWMTLRERSWDLRLTNEYEWLCAFWRTIIAPRFGSRPAILGEEPVWNEVLLLAEMAALRRQIGDRLDLEVADLSVEESRLVVSAGLFPAALNGKSLDALGRAFYKGVAGPRNTEKACTVFEVAAAMGHPAAFNNLARLHDQWSIQNADLSEAERLYRAAIALGNPHAPYHLSRLIAKGTETPDVAAEAEALARLAAERGYDPEGQFVPGGS